MQDPSKTDDKSRRTTPIRIVEGNRLGSPQADALREVHSSLVRAGQNLYNLVQSNQGSNGSPPAGNGLAYPQAQAYAPATTVPSYPPGYQPSFQQPAFAGFAQPGFAAGYPQPSYPAGIPQAPTAPPASFGAFGIAPALAQWGSTQAMASPWKALATDIAGALGALQPIATALGSLQHAAAIVPGLPGTMAPAAPASIADTGRAPACDIFDEGKQFVCLVDLPGVKAAQVELLCTEQAFVVAAYREAESDVAGSLVHGERTLAAMRTIALPAEVQTTAIKATLNNGVLSVVLPKVNPTEGPRRVKVQG